MTELQQLHHNLMVAAIDVVTSLSEQNLRSKSLSDPIVRRNRIKALEAAIEAIQPGIIVKTYEIIGERKK